MSIRLLFTSNFAITDASTSVGDEDINKVRLLIQSFLEIFSDVWGVGVLNLPPSPWLSIALSPSVRRRGHILFAKALFFFGGSVNVFMADQIPVLQFSRDGMGMKDHSYSHKLGVFQHLKPIINVHLARIFRDDFARQKKQWCEGMPRSRPSRRMLPSRPSWCWWI